MDLLYMDAGIAGRAVQPGKVFPAVAATEKGVAR